jgi:preprotein translocase subunit SecG
MSLLESGLLVVHVIVALVICGIVLLQHGKGADMGAAFGSGSSGSVFGSSGSANFLSRSTAVLAAVFFLTSIVLTWYATTNRDGGVVERSVIDRALPKAPTSDVPSLPAPAAGTQVPAAPPAAAPAPGAPTSPASPPGSKAGEIPK